MHTKILNTLYSKVVQLQYIWFHNAANATQLLMHMIDGMTILAGKYTFVGDDPISTRNLVPLSVLTQYTRDRTDALTESSIK